MPGRDALLDVGQVVIYKPDKMFRDHTLMKKLKWKLARIAKLHRSCQDGGVRSVDLQFYDPKTEKWSTMESPSIKNIARLETELTEKEKRANIVRVAV